MVVNALIDEATIWHMNDRGSVLIELIVCDQGKAEATSKF
jgi:hypothetical protein